MKRETPIQQARTTTLALLVALILAPAAAQEADLPPQRRVRSLMGTVCEITTWSSAETTAAVNEAFDEIGRLEAVFSLYRPDSELSRLNSSPRHRAIPCSPDLFSLADAALRYAASTEGTFDPTIEPLAAFWRRGTGWTDREWNDAARAVGPGSVQLLPSQAVLFTRDGAGLNFDGIAKGHALDRAADILRSRGVDRALLNFGGQILVVGGPRGGWSIDVADPETGEPLARFVLQSGSVATSSQRIRAVTRAGRREGHVIDPRKAEPVRREGSATVIAATAAAADALSKSLLILGPKDGPELLARRHPEASGVVVGGTVSERVLWTSANFPPLTILKSGARLAANSSKEIQ